MWDAVSPFIVWIIGLYLLRYISFLVLRIRLPILKLYLYHSLFSVFYFVYSLSNPADSFGYYRAGTEGLGALAPGTLFVEGICSLLYSAFHLSYLSTFLVFNISGSLGFIIFYALIITQLIHIPPLLRRYCQLLIYFPSVSFWSSAIGKDSISFLAVNLAIWSFASFSTRRRIALISFLLMFFVRPHIALLFLICALLPLLFSRYLSLQKRIIFLLIATCILVFSVGFVVSYVGLTGIDSLAFFTDYVSTRQSLNLEGSSGIDISSYPFFFQPLLYLFLPIFTPPYTILSLVASFENLTFAILLVYLLFLLFTRSSWTPFKIFLLSYSLCALFFLSITTSNTGIALRQKWMFLPALVILTISSASRLPRPTLETSSLENTHSC